MGNNFCSERELLLVEAATAKVTRTQNTKKKKHCIKKSFIEGSTHLKIANAKTS